MTRTLAGVLVLLLALPVSAQVITTGAPTAGSGGGSGNVTGTFTTGVVPMGTAAHTLSDSLNAVVIGSIGKIGFNNAGAVEVVSGTASLNNAGIFAGDTSALTVHDLAAETDWQFTIYNDTDTIVNAVSLYVAGAYPTNSLGLYFGVSAGVSGQFMSFAPAITQINSGNFAFGPPSTVFIDAGTNNFAVNLNAALVQFSGFSNSFIVAQGQASQDLAIAVTPNAVAQLQQTNATHTGLITVSTVMTNTSGAATANGAQGLVAIDAGDATGNVFVHVQSPQITTLTGHGGLVLDSSLNASTRPYMVYQVDASHAVAFVAPTTSSPAFELFTLPAAYPAANGQPLVATTAGVMSFAAGVTATKTVRASGGASDCTLIFTGGVLTGGSC